MKKTIATAEDVVKLSSLIMSSDISSGRKLTEANDILKTTDNMLELHYKIIKANNDLKETVNLFTKTEEEIRMYKKSLLEEANEFIIQSGICLNRINTYFEKYGLDCAFDIYNENGQIDAKKTLASTTNFNIEISELTMNKLETELFEVQEKKLQEEAIEEGNNPTSLHSKLLERLDTTRDKQRAVEKSITLIGKGVVKSIHNKKNDEVNNTGPDLDI